MTDAISQSWYQGQLALGVEMLGFGTSEPV